MSEQGLDGFYVFGPEGVLVAVGQFDTVDDFPDTRVGLRLD